MMTIEEMKKNEWFVGWSGGKDSTATIIKMLEYDIPIKKVGYVHQMYDKTIPAMYPVLDEWIIEKANYFRSLGIDVEIVEGVQTAREIIDTKYKRSKYDYLNGTSYGIGALARGMCKFQPVKVKTFDKYFGKENFRMLGICADEVERFERLNHSTETSLLYTLGITQSEAMEICRNNNLLSPVYELGFIKRDGCFFCPNVLREQRAWTEKNHPELYEIIKSDCEDWYNRVNDNPEFMHQIRMVYAKNHWFEDYMNKYQGGKPE